MSIYNYEKKMEILGETFTWWITQWPLPRRLLLIARSAYHHAVSYWIYARLNHLYRIRL